MLRDSYDDDALYSLNDLIDRLCAVDLLHVDDVGAEQSSAWVLEQLYTIVNTRYEDGRAVLLTTNLGRRPSCADQIGDRTVSRLNEICDACCRCTATTSASTSDFELPEPARSPPGAGRWLSDADRAWEAADPDEPPAYGRPRRTA